MAQRQQRPDPDEAQRRQEESQAQTQATSVALQQALEEAGIEREEIIDKLTDVDVDSLENPKLEAQLGPELSSLFALANETQTEYRRHRWLNENSAGRLASAQDPGRIAREHPSFLELAHGTHNRPDAHAPRPMTQTERRQMRKAITEVKTALQSLGKDSKALDALTEITAVSELRKSGDDEDDSSGGILSRIYS